MGWQIFKLVRANGRCPFDDWYDSISLTDKDRAAFDAKKLVIERTQGALPPETLKKYKTSLVYELKIRGDKKQLRPLSHRDEQNIIILRGAIEKGGKIPKGHIESAHRLLEELHQGAKSVLF